MQRYYTKTFFRFLCAFLALIAIAFGVALFASGGQSESSRPTGIDNVALPK